MICNNAIVFTKIYSVLKIIVLSMQCVLLHEQKYLQPSQIPQPIPYQKVVLTLFAGLLLIETSKY